MVLTKTPICNFGEKTHSFELTGIDAKVYKLEDCLGKSGTLIMFICNHCPYVKAVIKDIVDDAKNLKRFGIKTVAIMSNDTINYPDDSFDKMINFSKENEFEFPYLISSNFSIEVVYVSLKT